MPIRLRLILLTLLLALGAQSLAHAVEGGRQYTIKPGDTLGAISLSLGVPLARLVAVNNLADADHILAGQTLLLPDDGGPRPAGSTTEPGSYTVRAGDSLSRIATDFGVSLASLVEANNLADPDRLIAGQKLTIPGGQRSGGAEAAPRAAGGASPGGEVGRLLGDAATRYKVDPTLVKAVAWYLSAWKPDAGSPGGAVGVMQITTAAQEWVGPTLLKRAVDRNDPGDNVEIGVAYLAYLINKFGDERQGVAAYLQGPAGLARNGLSATTSRALETIYGSRGRFSAGAAAPAPPGAPAPPDISAAVVAAARAVSADARLGIAARNLATGARVDVRSSEVFHSASVNKVPILVEAFRQFEAGSLAREAVNGYLERMITQSDNDAANHLVDLLGEPRINSTMAGLGLGSTILNNHFSSTLGPRDPGFNQTTPAEMAKLFTLLATDKLVSAGSSQEMRSLLFRTQDTSKLVRGLPPGTKVAHKSGWYIGVANDAGIVYAPRATYILAVFTEGAPDDETGDQLIAAISRSVYEAWGN